VSAPLVVVSAGTYHLPFNRLVDWMEPWVKANDGVHVIMQHGPSRELPGAENHDILPYAALLELCALAQAIVLQGGAGGVMDMRQLRRIPIVVPRVPVDDEVVDDHQLLFTERAAELNTITRATTKEQLWHSLDAALAGTLQTYAALSEETPGVANLAVALAEVPPPLGAVDRLRRLSRTSLDLAARR
jgi:UDP-N-acetylglucosamine transferase subunit ALG13